MNRVKRLIARVGAASSIITLGPDGSVLVSGDESGGAGSSDASASYLGHGRVRITRGSDSVLAHVVDDVETRWVFLAGHVFEVEVQDVSARARRRRPAAGHESLSAPMPATVVRIPVAVGQIVARGTALVVLEAMKMELPLRAPCDAVVEAIRCREGELVQPGTPLVDLDETARTP